MEGNTVTNRTNSVRMKSDSNNIMNKYYSVHLPLNGTGPTYLFKLRNTPINGLCILVKEDSTILKQLKVGNVLKMEYNPIGSSDPSTLKTQINSKNSHDRIAGHSLIGLSIIDGQHEHL